MAERRLRRRKSKAGYTKGWGIRVWVPGSLDWDWCAYCGVSKADTLDHIIPVSANEVPPKDNLVPACRSCNVAFGSLVFESFYEKRLWLYTRYRLMQKAVEKPENIEVIFPDWLVEPR